MSTQQQREALTKARANTQAANRAYKAAWRKDPTARGWAKVDVALEALNQAEANERALELEMAQ